MRKSFLFIASIIMLLLAGCGASSSSANQNGTIPAEYAGKVNPLGGDAAAAGAEVFKNYCEACHGKTGYGDGPAGEELTPRPKNLAELQSQVKDDYLFWRINAGKDGTAMVAWKGTLTDEQIWQVIAFIRTLK